MAQNHLCKMQRYVANIAITPSVFRGKGRGGCMRKAQAFLGSLDLNPLATIDPSEYAQWLDYRTEQLLKNLLPIKDLWGPARKALNIFMTMALMNRFLCEEYALERLKDVLEVPLDENVGKKLSDRAEGKLPNWTTLKAVDSEKNREYQKFAQTVAEDLGIPRGLLDVLLWPTES